MYNVGDCCPVVFLANHEKGMPWCYAPVVRGPKFLVVHYSEIEAATASVQWIVTHATDLMASVN